eukprot:scaffold177515_cov21-Prasinocladus_malaysianus.AAC.1
MSTALASLLSHETIAKQAMDNRIKCKTLHLVIPNSAKSYKKNIKLSTGSCESLVYVLACRRAASQVARSVAVIEAASTLRATSGPDVLRGRRESMSTVYLRLTSATPCFENAT